MLFPPGSSRVGGALSFAASNASKCSLIVSLNRKIHRAYARVQEGNFALDSLLGFDLCARSAGVIGAGQIGMAVARILKGFGCRVLVSDPAPSSEMSEIGVELVALDRLLAGPDVVTLHCPTYSPTPTTWLIMTPLVG